MFLKGVQSCVATKFPLSSARYSKYQSLWIPNAMPKRLSWNVSIQYNLSLIDSCPYLLAENATATEHTLRGLN